MLLSRGLDYVRAEKMETPKEGIREVERTLKALIKSLETKHSNP